MLITGSVDSLGTLDVVEVVEEKMEGGYGYWKLAKEPKGWVVG